ncbi:hypothetical protein SCHPADRAFT_946975 [Schizopora paradoxa]|uniref:Uncharacterized protein n=1 Tax=Schizopora paradoxa TaxID=27342 RepID=A0A0H2R213_9AGAM|nr:hypothetical protein SCHPADRAFT_946975 [Schizopora paradoxa]
MNLALLTFCSDDLKEVEKSLYLLIATSIAMTITLLICGFEVNPQITLQDGLVVVYLLALTWVSIAMSLQSRCRFARKNRVVTYLSILHFCFTLTSVIVFLAEMDHFGSSSNCNSEAVVVLFRPFRALQTGRIVGFVSIGLVLGIYAGLTFIGWRYTSPKTPSNGTSGADSTPASTLPRNELNVRESNPPGTAGEGTAGPGVSHELQAPNARNAQASLVGGSEGRTSLNANPSSPEKGAGTRNQHLSKNAPLEIFITLTMWALGVMNTELLILRNDFSDANDKSQWQFGQVMAMLMVISPLVDVLNCFKEWFTVSQNDGEGNTTNQSNTIREEDGNAHAR